MKFEYCMEVKICFAKSGTVKQNYKLFELETNNTENVFIIAITSFVEFVSVKVDEHNKIMLLKLEPYVGDLDFSDEKKTEIISLKLPEFIEIKGYFQQRENNKIWTVFQKMNTAFFHSSILE